MWVSIICLVFKFVYILSAVTSEHFLRWTLQIIIVYIIIIIFIILFCIVTEVLCLLHYL